MDKQVKFYKQRGGEFAKVMHEFAETYGEKHGMTQLDYCCAAAILFYQAALLFMQTEGVTERIALSIELGLMNEIVKKQDGKPLFHDITSSTLANLFGVDFVDFLDNDEKKAFETILYKKS